MSGWKAWAAPAYLLLCLILGGSTQGIWANLGLQLLAVAIIAWATLSRPPAPPTSVIRHLWWICGLALALVALHLIPLPPAAWTSLPDRDRVADGFALLGLPLPWMPLSLAPYATLATIQTLLPPLAMLALMVRLDAFTERRLVAAMLLAALAGVVLGALQVTATDTGWYLYRHSAVGAGTGFFANSNHMGALLLTCLPFLAAIAGERWRRAKKPQARSVIMAIAGGMTVVLGIGVLLNGSAAVLLLGAPVAAASLLIALRPPRRRLRQAMAGIAVMLVAGAIAGALLLRSGVDRDNSISVSSRLAIWSDTIEATVDHLPLGSGVGTFAPVYRAYEDPARIERAYVNHAHNDYLEIALESGIPGLALLSFFLVWWAGRSAGAWRLQEGSAYLRAASVASATLLVHSLVDFPLRNAAMSSVMAVCVALLALPPRRSGEAEPRDELRPSRHMTL